MKTFALTVFFVLLTFFNCFSQKLDSLYIQLKIAPSTLDSLAISEKICRILISKSTPKEGILRTKEFLRLSNRTGNWEKSSKAYKYLSEYYMNLRDYTKSRNYSMEALKISNKMGNLNLQLLDYNQLGRVHISFDHYNEAIKVMKEAIMKYDGSKNNTIGTIYSNISVAYAKLSDHVNEIEYLKKGLYYSEKYGDIQQKSFSNYSLAYSLMENGQYKEAEKHFLEAIKDSLKFENSAYKYMNHHGLGINYSRWGKFDLALNHNIIALNHYHRNADLLYECDVLNNITSMYYNWGKKEESLLFGERAFQLAKKMNHKRLIAGTLLNLLRGSLLHPINNNDVTKYLRNFELYRKYLDSRDKDVLSAYWKAKSSIYENDGDFQKKLQALEQHYLLEDSITYLKLENKIEEISIKYKTQKKENEILKLNKERIEKDNQLEQQKRNLLLSFLGLALLLLSLSGMYLLYRRTTKQRDLIFELQKEQHHTLKNNLGFIDTFIEVAKTKITDPEIVQVLDDLKNRIFTLFSIHEIIYKQNSLSGKAKIHSYISILINKIGNSFSDDKLTFENRVNEEIEVEYKKSFYIGLIINEFVTNSFKYGNKNPTIEITLERIGNRLNFKIWDKNTFISDKFNPNDSKGFGLGMINLMAVQLGGKGEWTKNNGLAFSVRSFI
jgi:two-component system, sensor histidine kinase PdtaS